MAEFNPDGSYPDLLPAYDNETTANASLLIADYQATIAAAYNISQDELTDHHYAVYWILHEIGHAIDMVKRKYYEQLAIQSISQSEENAIASIYRQPNSFA